MEHDSLEVEYYLSPEFESIDEAYNYVKTKVYELLEINEKTRGMDTHGRKTTKKTN